MSLEMLERCDGSADKSMIEEDYDSTGWEVVGIEKKMLRRILLIVTEEYIMVFY